MRTIHVKWLSIFFSIAAAVFLTPVLIHASWVKYFLVYSIFSNSENIFLLVAISMYGLLQLVTYRMRRGHWRAVPHTAFFYCISAWAVLVLGLASLALLWVIPMALLLFNDVTQNAWRQESPQDAMRNAKPIRVNVN
jgi:hypothetical protein